MNRKGFELLMAVVLIIAVYVVSANLYPKALESADGSGKAANTGWLFTDNFPSADKTVRTVVLDAGHGGSDGGKVSVTGSLEKDLNLDIVLKLKEILENNSYKVILTREDANGTYNDNVQNRKLADMKKRCELINTSGADIVVSIHLNSFTDAKVNGAQVFYYKGSTEGKKLAHCIQNGFQEHLNPNNKRVEKENNTYYMLINTDLPTVIAECGFLSNRQEAELIDTEEYRSQIAQAVYQGIAKYYGDGYNENNH